MNKVEFLEQLRRGLNGLPQEEIEERVTFYSEMIDDRIEEGFSEEEAVEDSEVVNSVGMGYSQAAYATRVSFIRVSAFLSREERLVSPTRI